MSVYFKQAAAVKDWPLFQETNNATSFYPGDFPACHLLFQDLKKLLAALSG